MKHFNCFLKAAGKQSFTKVDFPQPDSPVITVNRFFGRAKESMFIVLFLIF